MDRKKFLKKGVLGIGSIIAIPSVISSCNSDNNNIGDNNTGVVDPNCSVSPAETAGPFPIRTPAQLIRENIVGNRSGVALMITLNIQNTNANCSPIQGALVDIWHCDAKGNYSEYDGQIEGDFTSENFLRGRQTTDANGNATFVSIFPGWYPGRTPHLHVEIKRSNGTSLLITQVSWSEAISNTVYASPNYNGNADTNNSNDGIVSDANLADSLVGNVTDGYVLMKNIKVAG
ncbi:MAG: intradiol ring-cleavage dioxygenase [Flavobacteriaceae bacterium]|nr:MAG: intradiol ring-cleavage dioxygenase [Flavobacteriaceae bacterium]